MTTTLPAGWKPIESAPKYTEVLVWRDDAGVFIAQLTTPDGVMTDAEQAEADLPDDFEEWFAPAYGWQEGDERPTHWMPLPEPPCATCNDQGAVGNILTAEPSPDCTPPASAQPSRDWELDCDHCNGSGHVFVKHQVAERTTDVQEFKEECECCEGRGFVFAFQDIPGIEEYVKACRPATTQDAPITVSLDPDPRGVSVGVWQGSRCIYTGAHAVPVGVQDSVVAGALFDLMGYITSQDWTVKLGGAEEAAIAVELLQRWAALRGLSLDNADVEGWVERRAPAAGDALRRAEVYRLERDHERAKNERLIAVLIGIHGLTLPAPIEMDGKTYVFTPPKAVEILHALSDRIRAIPGEIAASQQQEG